MSSVRAMSAAPMLGTVGMRGERPLFKLADALGDKVDKDQWVSNNFRSLVDKIAFHGGAGKVRGCPSLIE